MDQTIQARFESVDMATFAAENITRHFGGIKNVRVSYKNKQRKKEVPFVFSDMFTPVGSPMTPVMNNGPIPETFNGNALREKHQYAENNVSSREAILRLTIGENCKTDEVSCALRTNGAMDLTVN